MEKEIIELQPETLPQPAEIRTATGRVIKYLRRDEVKRMLQVMGGRDALLIKTLWNTGARISEVLSLVPGDFNFKEGYVTIRTLKKGTARSEKVKQLRVEIKGLELALKKKRSKIIEKTLKELKEELSRIEEEKEKVTSYRSIPLTSSFLTEVASYCYREGIKQDERIFPISRVMAFKIIKEAGRRAGIDPERCHPHAFRHGFAVNAVLSGVPPLVLRRWLGHAKMDSTLVYTEALAQDTRKYLERMEF